MAQTTAAGSSSWDQQFPAATRFTVLSNWGGAAVLDRETGLVWERTPDGGTRDWVGAQSFCNNRIVGNRLGWRVPTIQELLSLVDPSISSGLALPSGHPFNAHPGPLQVYWSATSSDNGAVAWVVRFSVLLVATGGKARPGLVWCVRGGQGVDVQ